MGMGERHYNYNSPEYAGQDLTPLDHYAVGMAHQSSGTVEGHIVKTLGQIDQLNEQQQSTLNTRHKLAALALAVTLGTEAQKPGFDGVWKKYRDLMEAIMTEPVGSGRGVSWKSMLDVIATQIHEPDSGTGLDDPAPLVGWSTLTRAADPWADLSFWKSLGDRVGGSTAAGKFAGLDSSRINPDAAVPRVIGKLVSYIPYVGGGAEKVVRGSTHAVRIAAKAAQLGARATQGGINLMGKSESAHRADLYRESIKAGLDEYGISAEINHGATHADKARLLAGAYYVIMAKLAGSLPKVYAEGDRILAVTINDYIDMVDRMGGPNELDDRELKEAYILGTNLVGRRKSRLSVGTGSLTRQGGKPLAAFETDWEDVPALESGSTETDAQEAGADNTSTENADGTATRETQAPQQPAVVRGFDGFAQWPEARLDVVSRVVEGDTSVHPAAARDAWGAFLLGQMLPDAHKKDDELKPAFIKEAGQAIRQDVTQERAVTAISKGQEPAAATVIAYQEYTGSRNAVIRHGVDSQNGDEGEQAPLADEDETADRTGAGARVRQMGTEVLAARRHRRDARRASAEVSEALVEATERQFGHSKDKSVRDLAVACHVLDRVWRSTKDEQTRLAACLLVIGPGGSLPQTVRLNQALYDTYIAALGHLKSAGIGRQKKQQIQIISGPLKGKTAVVPFA